MGHFAWRDNIQDIHYVSSSCYKKDLTLYTMNDINMQCHLFNKHIYCNRTACLTLHKSHLQHLHPCRIYRCIGTYSRSIVFLSYTFVIYDEHVYDFMYYIFTIWYSECIHIHMILCKHMDSYVLSTCGHDSGTSQLCTFIVGCPCQNWQLCMPEPTVAWWPLS